MLRTYQRQSLKSIDLGYAGRYAPTHAVHRAIQALKQEDSLELVRNGERLELQDSSGQVVCRLAKSYKLPDGKRCVEDAWQRSLFDIETMRSRITGMASGAINGN